jgi:3-dehydroquinate dehydratase
MQYNDICVRGLKTITNTDAHTESYVALPDHTDQVCLRKVEVRLRGTPHKELVRLHALISLQCTCAI